MVFLLDLDLQPMIKEHCRETCSSILYHLWSVLFMFLHVKQDLIFVKTTKYLYIVTVHLYTLPLQSPIISIHVDSGNIGDFSSSIIVQCMH